MNLCSCMHAGLEEALAGMPSLTEIDASGCTAITAFLAASNFQLTSLNLTGCAVLRRIVVGSPAICYLSASSCPRLLVTHPLPLTRCHGYTRYMHSHTALFERQPGHWACPWKTSALACWGDLPYTSQRSHELSTQLIVHVLLSMKLSPSRLLLGY